MTVNELIEYLKTLPKDYEVLLDIQTDQDTMVSELYESDIKVDKDKKNVKIYC